ncbi:MAG: CHAT domain-containing protein [Anaerolineae bacterium]|nr:CHAT domain-containing protein [Anaerolineae bacterium]
MDGQQPYADFLLPPTFARIAAAVQPGVPLVYLLTTEPGSLALILHRPDAQADVIVSQIRLDRFTAQDLDALLVERQGDQITGGYLPGQLGDHAWLTQHLDQTLTTLGDKFMGPLAAALRQGPFRSVHANQRALVLVPAGRLSLLPLHAACYLVNGATRRFLDDFTVTYVPSIMTLADVQARLTDAHGPLLAIGNPLPHRHPAWFTDWLAQEVSAAHSGGTLLLHAAATGGGLTPPSPQRRVTCSLPATAALILSILWTPDLNSRMAPSSPTRCVTCSTACVSPRRPSSHCAPARPRSPISTTSRMKPSACRPLSCRRAPVTLSPRSGPWKPCRQCCSCASSTAISTPVSRSKSL